MTLLQVVTKAMYIRRATRIMLYIQVEMAQAVLANLEFDLYLWPYLKNRNGKGAMASRRNAHRVSAQALPSRSNICESTE